MLEHEGTNLLRKVRNW